MKGGYVKVVDDDINAPFKTTYSEITGRKLND